MAEGGISTQKWHAPTWLRLEGLFSAALLVPWQGAPPILDARQRVDEKRLARLCVALARSNALLTAWQALAIALVEPELREAIADSEDNTKLDAILVNAPALAAWFEQPVRSAAATELRAMIDNAVVLPAVQSAALAQWFDKPVARLASIAAEQLALQLEARGMRALPFVLGLPSSPAFRELAAQSSTQLRRLSASLAESPMRHVEPSLTDRWIADLYLEGRYLGRTRSDVALRGDAAPVAGAAAPTEDASQRETVRPGRPKLVVPSAIPIGSRPTPIVPPRPASIAAPRPEAEETAFGDDVSEPIAERAIDEEWITLADLRASIDAPRAEWPTGAPVSDASRAVLAVGQETPIVEARPIIALIPPPPEADVAAVDRAAQSSLPLPAEPRDIAQRSASVEELRVEAQTAVPVEARPAVPVEARPIQELDQPRPVRARRASSQLGLAIFAGALAGAGAVAMFMALAGRYDRRPALERTYEAEPAATVALPSVPPPADEPLAVVAPATAGIQPDPAPAATGISDGVMAAPVGGAAPIHPDEARPPSAGSALSAEPAASVTATSTALPPALPKTMSQTCELTLLYVQKGEIAQAIRRFESCLAPDRELVRQRIAQRSAADVRTKAEKGQCDEAAAIVAQVETIEAAAAAKIAFGSRCGSP